MGGTSGLMVSLGLLGLIGNRSEFQQLPRFSIDNARIQEIKALFARSMYLAVWLGDQNSLAVMDGDLRWTDLNLEWHGFRSPR